MGQDSVTITVPRAVIADLIDLTAEKTDRMHELLGRNAEGALSDVERSELERLVRIAEFGQIIALALAQCGKHAGNDRSEIDSERVG